jgi:predicted GIY-YIG superfamily endonuclease
MSIKLTYKKIKTIKFNDDVIISDHSCYILLSLNNNKFYIGYTTDFKHRLRQHNGEIVGGAKKTKKWRPWIPLCQITGFFDKSSALRFEYRLQHQKKKKKKTDNLISYIINILTTLIYIKDGSKINNSVINWPILTIEWYAQYHIYHPNVINIYLAFPFGNTEYYKINHLPLKPHKHTDSKDFNSINGLFCSIELLSLAGLIL